MERQPVQWITVFGLGGMRPASGTWGSLPPVLLAGAVWAVTHLSGAAPERVSLVVTLVSMTMLLMFSAACVAQGEAAEARFGEKDPSNAVADETAGQSVVLLGLPAAAWASPWHAAGVLAAAFLLFRVFDILKPWPASRLQSVPGGWGILLDDLVAGLMALAVLQAGIRIFV